MFPHPGQIDSEPNYTLQRGMRGGEIYRPSYDLVGLALDFRFEDNDAEIKRGAQLIVRESQVAQFVYLGEFGDTFRPGKHFSMISRASTSLWH